MPTGCNPNSRKGVKNLIPMNKRTKETQSKIAKMGAEASNKKQKEMRTIGQILRAYFNQPINDNIKEIANECGLLEATTNEVLLATPIIKNLMANNLNAVEKARDYLGLDAEKEAKIRLLNEEVELLKLQQESLKQENSLMDSLHEKVIINMDIKPTEKEDADN